MLRMLFKVSLLIYMLVFAKSASDFDIRDKDLKNSSENSGKNITESSTINTDVTIDDKKASEASGKSGKHLFRFDGSDVYASARGTFGDEDFYAVWRSSEEVSREEKSRLNSDEEATQSGRRRHRHRSKKNRESSSEEY